MKQFIVIAGIIFAVAMLVYGAFLPYGKAGGYIAALSNMGNVRTLQDFKDNYDAVFNFYSPVGDEEVTKFLASDIGNLVGQERQPEAVGRALAEYIAPHLRDNDPRHLLAGAEIYSVLWMRYHKGEDYEKAVGYYQKTLAIGPNLPPALYGLLGLYQQKGDKAGLRTVAATILTHWPDDVRVRPFLAQ